MILLNHGVSAWAVREYTFTRVDSLLWGAVAALIFRDCKLLDLWQQWSRSIFLVSCSLLGGISLTSHGFGYGQYWVQIAGYSVVGVFCANLILRCASCRLGPLTTSLLSAGLLPAIGKISYGLYVFHFPIVQVVRSRNSFLAHWFLGESVAVFFVRLIECVIVCCVSWLVAYISFHAYEKHWIRLKHFFDYEMPSVPTSEVLPGEHPNAVVSTDEDDRSLCGSVKRVE